MDEKTRYRLLAVICTILSGSQIIFGVVALFDPEWLVFQNTTLAFVERFQNPVNPDKGQIRDALSGNDSAIQVVPTALPTNLAVEPVNVIYLRAAIGLLETVINGDEIFENREGLKGVVGFIMVSLLASLFSLAHSISILMEEYCPKCSKCCQMNRKKCRSCMEKIIEKLNSISKGNYSAGVSAGVADAMFAYTTDDLVKGTFGSGFILMAVSSGMTVFTLFISFFNDKPSDEDQPTRSGQRRQGRNVDDSRI
uniref:Uncharacterized LOC100179055 n=1 Tax=Ciona intestinalis TaxID=7719 RepID=H2XWQ9_CIOIN|nr:uncharacterized protein LOC100179055 [Ciona intestinalis]|eukprot:XP_002127011.1 uncharacterized protein LOC100179055 [Ciona intestinalis]